MRTEIDESLETVFIGNVATQNNNNRNDNIYILLLSEPDLGDGIREYKVVFLGSCNVGKSSIINQFLRTEHDDVFGREFLKLRER